MKKVVIKLIPFIFLIATVLFILILSTPKHFNSKQIDCNKPFDIVYLKHSEIDSASVIANKINGVVVIPEDNQVIARTELLECKNFDVTNYLDMEEY